MPVHGPTSWCLPASSGTFAPRPLAKEVDHALSVPDADGEIGTGHYDIIQVSDGMVVTLYNWTHLTQGLIWCLAMGNGYDVSHLKWMGGKTYSKIVHDLLAECPGFSAAAGLGFRARFPLRGQYPSRLQVPRSRALLYHRLPPPQLPPDDPPGVWNIQTADLGTGTPRSNSAGLPAVLHQTVYSCEDLAVRRRSGLPMAYLSYISRTALEDAKAVIAGKSTLPFNYGFILRSRNPEATGLLRHPVRVPTPPPGTPARVPAPLSIGPRGDRRVVAAGVLRHQGVPHPDRQG